jgi:hypothetical protein
MLTGAFCAALLTVTILAGLHAGSAGIYRGQTLVPQWHLTIRAFQRFIKNLFYISLLPARQRGNTAAKRPIHSARF